MYWLSGSSSNGAYVKVNILCEFGWITVITFWMKPYLSWDLSIETSCSCINHFTSSNYTHSSQMFPSRNIIKCTKHNGKGSKKFYIKTRMEYRFMNCSDIKCWILLQYFLLSYLCFTESAFGMMWSKIKLPI